MASRRLMILGLVLTLSATSAQGVINVDFEDLSLEGSEASWSGTYPVDGTGGSGEVTTFTS
ncbi:MAG: hypothetical protein ACYTBV_19340, partial [Planctomycetota bacterium]